MFKFDLYILIARCYADTSTPLASEAALAANGKKKRKKEKQQQAAQQACMAFAGCLL